MSTETPPPVPTTPPTIPIPVITPPIIKHPDPVVIHLRVLIHGEVDIDVPSNTDIDAYSLLVAKDIKAKAPNFKITKVLIAEGFGGPIATPL